MTGLSTFIQPRTLRWLLVAGLLIGVVALAGIRGLLWWPVAASPIDVQLTDITNIEIQPVPEGPEILWNNPPTSPFSEQRHMIEAAIPSPLPGPEVQPLWCRVGGNLIVNLRDGRAITYGPCRHPEAIRALWTTIERIESNGRCTEPCAPTD